MSSQMKFNILPMCLGQKWPGIRSGFCFYPYPDTPKPKMYEKPNLESLFVLKVAGVRLVFIKFHFLCKNIAEFRLHRWLPEPELESDSQI